jgi:phage/plasmid-like protein (TIGR03299 family)
MAHNINFNEQTEKHSFFSVKEKAWHNLGQIITDYPTSAEAIIYAGLNYTVEKRPLFTVDKGIPDFNNPDLLIHNEIEVPNFYANFRSDTEDVLGVVGKDYSIVQNIDAFAFFDGIVGGKDGILYETAGALGKGERIFITAKLPNYIRVGRNDCIEKYIFLTTSHDGYGSVTAAFTPVRVVCQNTLNAALKNHINCIKIRHTASAADRLKQAHKLLGITNQLANELEEVFNHWSKIRITDRAVKRLVQLAMAPNRETLQYLQNGNTDELSTVFNNMVSSITEYALTSPTQQEATTKGTLFGAYNAVTGYFQNVRSYKDEESKLKSIMFGTGLQRSQTAFNLCEEYTKHGLLALQLN